MRIHIRKWFSEMIKHIQDHPRRAILYFVYSFYLTIFYAITSRRPIGKNVFESNWDVLIVLDACRVNTLQEVADEYDFITEVDTIWSVGSTSPEWIANTFRKEWLEEINETTYISANGYSEEVLAQNRRPPTNNTTPVDLSTWSIATETDLKSHVPLWRINHDETYQSVLPEAMTDRAIVRARNNDDDRLMLHYIQPHLPYIGSAYRSERDLTEIEKEGYQLLEKGATSREKVYDPYKENLRFVLDEVSVLLRNIDAENVVITADHGEAFGEWAAYGHPEGFPHPIVRKVPWVETSATDEHTKDPSVDENKGISTEVEDHLRDLGYK